jgi:hypothetical protein
MDSQLESLRKIKEAKEFAKAMKADNAAVPTQLWDDRIKSEGVSQGARDKTFVTFRRLGHRRFLRHLIRDCASYMRLVHGPSWVEALRLTKEGQPTELKRDWAAIASILWHNVHTNWFEFNAGSRLIHF